MDAKVIKSVCLTDEVKVFALVEDRGGGMRLTINGANNSVSINMNKKQAIGFFHSAMKLTYDGMEK